MEEEAHRGVDVEEADTDPDYGTNRDVGDDTNDGATGDDTTDGGEHIDGSQLKRQQKDRRPNVLNTVKQALKEKFFLMSLSRRFGLCGAYRVT
jgi:hypothetical protein